jgi:hypothetical protein
MVSNGRMGHVSVSQHEADRCEVSETCVPSVTLGAKLRTSVFQMGEAIHDHLCRLYGRIGSVPISEN